MAKTTKKGQSFIGGEISKLMKKGPGKGPLKGKKFGQKQAIAASLNVARKKGFKVPTAKDESSASIFDGLLAEGSAAKPSTTSLFDDLVSDTVESEPQSTDHYAQALSLVETLGAIKNKLVK